MLKSFKSIVSGKKIGKSSQDSDNKDEPNPLSTIANDTKKVASLISSYFVNLFSDIKVMKVKSKNLLQTNINLGLKHLNNDNISDAIFRFRIIAFIWPNHIKTYYYLAHCYIIKQNFYKAQKYLKILLQMDPSYESKVSNMIKKIDNNIE